MAPDSNVVIAWLARLGFFTKGVLYVVVGWLAASTALGYGGRITSADGALIAVLRQPLGSVLLLIAAIGLFGYSAWRLVQAIVDPDNEGTDWKGLGKRATYVLRGVVHGLLGWQAVQLYRGLGGRQGQGEGEEEAARMLATWPFGEWVLVLVGIALIGYAFHEARRAWTCRLPSDLDTRQLRKEAGNWAVGVSRLGLAARATVFTVIGISVIRAGLSGRVSQVEGTEGALRSLAHQPGDVGRWVFIAVSVGLIAYGFYQMIHARYLHIRRVT